MLRVCILCCNWIVSDKLKKICCTEYKDCNVCGEPFPLKYPGPGESSREKRCKNCKVQRVTREFVLARALRNANERRQRLIAEIGKEEFNRRTREYRNANKEKMNARKKAIRAENPELFRRRNAISRMKKPGAVYAAKSKAWRDSLTPAERHAYNVRRRPLNKKYKTVQWKVDQIVREATAIKSILIVGSGLKETIE